ncbi:hypothetical protein M501DRAFT_1010407 [Patellaria atrata CBS 101060]|uniref:EDC4-like protein pdc1 beta-propeller domain-containing protein n=1 Tax=Patellaria atrata CBS 101060 TaxID=1346257 RepID=A0A9P4SD93_9PEZI|nr:hypothetical protein M501DRAFT_1010407 [Patellaria atrata CBS 101060]
MADLQELFARLKSTNNPATTSNQQPSSTIDQSTRSQSGLDQNHNYRPPSVSSPLFSPSPGGPQPHHASAIMSPNTSALPTPLPEQNVATPAGDRTANLLNLLKFSQNNQGPAPSQSPFPSVERRASHNLSQASQADNNVIQGRTTSASDLSPPSASPVPSRPEMRGERSTLAMENPQDFLLKLLNQPKPTQGDPLTRRHTDKSHQSVEPQLPEVEVDDLAQDLADAKLENVDSNPATTQQKQRSHPTIFGVDEPHAFEPPSTNKSSIFTYVNPFEQLSASSPRNRTPKPEAKSGSTTPKIDILKNSGNIAAADASLPTQTAHKHSASDTLSSPINLPPSMPNHPHRDNAEMLERESVVQAVSEVGKQVDKQIEEALAAADVGAAESNTLEAAVPKDDVSIDELEQAVHEVAVEAKEELKNEDSRREFKSSLPKPLADAVEEVINEAAQENVADDWESADAEDNATKNGEYLVRVYNFPIRPFVAIDINRLQEPPLSLRPDNILDVARLKKPFEQIDRTLVVATKNFIVYALPKSGPKSGGFRLIQQDTGQYKQVFANTNERIFNLSICAPAIGGPAAASILQDAETILATGIDGTVYWAMSSTKDPDLFTEKRLEDTGLIFPPSQAHDDNTSGGQLKTRAKKSNRHPEFFGLGRGRCIYIIWPQMARDRRYMDTKTRVCDTVKYLAERQLQITIGKAGKDFAFSEDDTTIVSLDKAGKMKFWDIRELTNSAFNSTPGSFPSYDIRTPLLTLSTCSPSDKSWPTSVFFVDKERPCVKGIACRYLIVGMKQNHTLQLWDLCLLKPVQEINFPHENESDPICSIGYHPRTGVIVVGHPTRNSIYFIHLSAPVYNLSPMRQARFIEYVATKSNKIPKPESTAIMSGVREFSFASKGQLRSVEILNDPINANTGPEESPALFELYVMHSKGVTCMSIKREDLGWSQNNRVLHPVDAQSEGAITVSELRSFSVSTADSSTTGETPEQPEPATPSRTTRESSKKETAASSRVTQTQNPEQSIRASTLAKVESKQDAARAAILNGADKTEKIEKFEKSEKKKKKRGAGAETTSQPPIAPSLVNPSLATPSSYAMAAQRTASPAMQSTAAPEVGLTSQPAESSKQPEFSFKDLKKLESGISTEITKALNGEFESLYRRIDEDKRVQDAASAAKQDAVLRLVSSTLTDNVEKSLSRIISENLRSGLLPPLSEVVVGAIERGLKEALSQAVHSVVPREIRSSLPIAISRALQEPDVLQIISDLVSTKVASIVDSHLATALSTTIVPTFTSNAISAAQNIATEVERRVGEQLREAEVQRQTDSTKIEQLTSLVHRLSETIQSMAASQADFQGEILKLQSQVGSSASRDAPAISSAAATPTRAATPPPEKTDEDRERDEITAMLRNGQYEEGTIRWLQCGYQGSLFDTLFIRVNPNYIKSLSPLVALSISAAVTASLETNISERLQWLEMVFNSIDPRDPELEEVTPKIMDVLSQRLQGAYMQVAEGSPQNPILRKISQLARRAIDLKALALS